MITVGILGLGAIGTTHAAAVASLAGSGTEVRVEAYSGGSPQVAAGAGWPQARPLDPETLITDPRVDVIAVCTPSGLHARQAIAALQAGKHVVVEKPMAVTTAEALALRDHAAATDLIVSPLAQRRFEPLNVALKRLIDSGSMGRVVLGEVFVHWHRTDAYYAEARWRNEPGGGGGSLMNQGLHNVDLLCWLLGDVLEVTGMTATLGHQIDVEDTTVACLRFSSGALGLIATTTAAPTGEPAELAIRTTKGSTRINQYGICAWEFAGLSRPGPVEQPCEPISGASDPAAIGLSGHIAQWTDVLDALYTGRAPSVGVEDGLATVAVLDGIYHAADTGETTAVANR